jgi:DNA excision repair protein ERCC-3
MGAHEMPVRVVGRWTLYVQRQHERFHEAREILSAFASIRVRTPSLYAFKVDKTYLWNAFALDISPGVIIESLRTVTKQRLPKDLIAFIQHAHKDYETTFLTGDWNAAILQAASGAHNGAERCGEPARAVAPDECVRLKSEYGAKTLSIRDQRRPLALGPVEIEMQSHAELDVRSYQREAAARFCAPERPSGCAVLPCGSGKTLVAILAMAQIKMRTLVLSPSPTGLEEWARELRKWTTVVVGAEPERRGAVVLATYAQAIRSMKAWPMDSFGLIIFDEVHLASRELEHVPCIYAAPQRLGLTATLCREDDYAASLHNLVGPKRYELSWRALEGGGYIASPKCIEVMVPLSVRTRAAYDCASAREQSVIAATNEWKLDVVGTLLQRHSNDHVLIMSSHNQQLEAVASKYKVPVITGQTTQTVRRDVLDAFRRGDIGALGISKIGNNSIDLPNANVGIQISGTFGSRQEEAQRLGRLMRPKTGLSSVHFYSLVSKDTIEEEKSTHRQFFLAEQGYSYVVIDHDEID